MACKYVNGQYIFQQPCSLWNAPCVHNCGYIHLSSSMPGSRKKCCAKGCLSSASDNFDKELMMDHDLDKLLQFLRQVITSSLEFLKKSSTYNNLVTMSATVVCNYNQTHAVRYLLFHIWWYSISCREICDTVKYLQRSQEWKSILRWSTFSLSRCMATCRRHQCCP